MAAISVTPSTKYTAMRSASRWMDARVRCASPTMWTMRASSVSEPMRSARNTKEPEPLIVAPVTRSPAAFAAGTGSPLTIDSSMRLQPSSTRPSPRPLSPPLTPRPPPPRAAPRPFPAGFDAQPIPDLDVLELHLLLASVRLEPPGEIRRELEQVAHRL